MIETKDPVGKTVSTTFARFISHECKSWSFCSENLAVPKQIEMPGAQSKCFGDFDARIEMNRNRSN
jgi:hypothetical protein